MAELSPETKKLLAMYQAWQDSQKPKDGVVTIHVDEVAMKVAAFYERLRTIVDWKEEHLMRRAAIIRKLKRKFLDNSLTNQMAESLVLELIRGGYFPNDRIEEAKIEECRHIIDKYVFILNHTYQASGGRLQSQFYHWLLEVASCEIEETLDPATREMALIDYMFQAMKARIKVNDKMYERNLLAPQERDTQIYIAVQQALYKLDNPIVSYNLLKYQYPQWQHPTQEQLSLLAEHMQQIWQYIERELAHPLGKKFYAICEKYDTAYLIIGDILSKNAAEGKQATYEPEILEGNIRTAYAKRLANLKIKIRRAAAYSTASIFITKILSLLILEVILARLFTGRLDLVTLIADIAIPTTLMFVLVATVKSPSNKNINLVVMEVMKIFYQKEKTDAYEIKMPKRRGVFTTLALSLTYLLGALVSFGCIFGVLRYLNFPISSIIINIIFIALILFAGTLVQKRSQELTIEEQGGGFLMFVSDILFLPLTGLGQWMSNKWKRYNAFTAFLNALIDMPFSLFVEFLERWRYFIKEKKEDLR